MSSRNRDGTDDAARHLQMQQAATTAALQEQEHADTMTRAENVEKLPASSLERSGDDGSSAHDKPSVAVSYGAPSNMPRPPLKSEFGLTASPLAARKPLSALSGVPPAAPSEQAMKSASASDTFSSSVRNSNSIPVAPMNQSAPPTSDHASDESKSESDDLEDGPRRHGFLQRIKACRKAGFSCVPKWAGNIIFKLIVCLCLLVPAFIFHSIPHDSYDLSVSRNGKPVYFAMEVIRFSLYFAGAFAIYSVAIYFVEIVVRLVQSVSRLFCCWKVSHKCSNRLAYLNGTKDYIVYIFFFMGTFILTRHIIVDNDIQLYKPPAPGNSSAMLAAMAETVAAKAPPASSSCGSYTFICGGKKMKEPGFCPVQHCDASASSTRLSSAPLLELEGEYDDDDGGSGIGPMVPECRATSFSKNTSSSESSSAATKSSSKDHGNATIIGSAGSGPDMGPTAFTQHHIAMEQLKGELISNYGWVFYWTQFILVCFLFSIMLAFEKLFVQTVAVSFHKRAFEARVAELNSKFLVFDHLVKIATHASYKPFSKIGDMLKGSLSSPVDGDDEDVERTISSLHAINLTGSQNDVREAFSRKEAKRNAEMLFKYLTANSGRDYIVADDLRPFYRGNGHEKAVTFLDPEALGHVTRSMMKEAICDLFKERWNLHDCLHGHGQIIGKFDNLLKGLLVLICVIVGLSLLNFSVTTYLTSMATFALSFTFVFGGFLKSIFEDLLYIFTCHPFDVGDTLLLDGEVVNVTKIEILSTTFTRWDGQLVYVPTQNLINKNVYNIRRSGYQSEVFEMQIAATTALEKIGRLRASVTEALAAEGSDFSGKVTLSGFDVDSDKMKIKFTVEHRGNFQDMAVKTKRHNKVKQILKEKLEALQITYFGV